MKRIKQIYEISKKGKKKKKKNHGIWSLRWWYTCLLKEGRNTEEGREFQRREVEGKEPLLNWLILVLESCPQ